MLLSFAKKDFVVSKREFARVVKTPFEKAFSMSNIKAGFKKCGIHPFDPNAIDQSNILPSFSSSPSTDESYTSAEVSSSSVAGADNNLNMSVLSTSEESQIPSVNPSPIVSSISSHADDGNSSPQVSSRSLTSTPVASGSAGSRSSSQDQFSTTPRCRPKIDNSLVRVRFVPQDLADIFVTPQVDERDKRPRRITGVRVLTSNEYVREKDRKEKEVSEVKQRRKEESERARKRSEEKRRVEGRERVNVPSSIPQVKTNKRSTSPNQRAAVHVQYVLQRDIERALQRVRAVTMNVFCASQGSLLLPPAGCFGLTATIAASGLMHTAHLAATRLHDTLCVKKCLSVTLIFFMFMRYFQHCALIFSSPQSFFRD